MKNYLIAILTILIIAIIYLLNFGEKSIFTYLNLKKQFYEKNQILKKYKNETNELKENIEKLNSESLDSDYLDKVAREKHNLSKADECIIYNE